MGHGLTLVKFRNGRWAPIPRDAIVSVLVQHGCKVPQLRGGSNQIELPGNEAGCSPLGEVAILTVKDNEVREFGLDRPQATTECRTLLFSLINQASLVMFPNYGTVIYAREDVFNDIPLDVLKQFSKRIVVNRPDDCAS